MEKEKPKYDWSDWQWPEGDPPASLHQFFQQMIDQTEKIFDEEYARLTKNLTKRFEAAADLVVDEVAENCILVRTDGMIELRYLTNDGPKTLGRWHDEEVYDMSLRPEGQSSEEYRILGGI